MTGALLLGLLIGMQHALEADHVAAVATVAARSRSARNIIQHGLTWGFGHGLILFGFVGGLLLLDLALSETLATGLEMIVGSMLIALGANLIRRLVKDRVHFHTHRHANGPVHLHAHSHARDPVAHVNSAHRHEHFKGVPWRSLIIGMTHGLAGTAALVALSASAAQSPLLGMAYVALFALGSIVGMFVLSAAIAVPLSYTSRSLGWLNHVLQGGISVFSIALGVSVLWGNGILLALPFS